MEKRIQEKSSLNYVNPAMLNVSRCHTISSTVQCSRRAQLKCKLLTGSYTLQANRAVFNQFQVDPTCKLCSIAPGTRQHYIAGCPVFEIERNIFKQKVCNYLPLRECDLQDPDTISRLALDSSAVCNHDIVDQSVISQLNLMLENSYTTFIKRESSFVK